MPPRQRITIGTRGSPLALTQTKGVIALLRKRFPKVSFIIKEIRTQGDVKADAPLESLPRGLFAKELEQALERGEIDLAVHSFKDLPTQLAPGFAIAAITKREDPRDVLVSPSYASLQALPKGARLGTSSPRRAAQMRAWRPDLAVLPIRGNVGTRIAKAGGPGFDGVVLAAAGVHRLGMHRHIREYIAPSICIPEPGQGALALEVRAGDGATAKIAAAARDRAATAAVTAEVAVLRALGGGCKTPIAAYAERKGAKLYLRAMVSDTAGRRVLRATASGTDNHPERLGTRLANRLLAMGAADVLAGEKEKA
ncbi:MAG: hydroxymethylbilane synthase [Chloroflexi bacterium]|nr:hydroxymethylbilane synthase [Chloroflexota bacterium]